MPKRDKRLIKSILEAIEKQTRSELAKPSILSDMFRDSNEPEGVLEYNFYLLVASGFIEGGAYWTNSGNDLQIDIKGLTWIGHDLLEQIREEGY